MEMRPVSLRRARRQKRGIVAALLVATLVACGGQGDAVVYRGATTLLPTIETLAASFETQRPNITVETAGGGTSDGIRSVASGAADLGGAARDLTAEELEMVWAVPLARDAIAIIVNKAMEIEDVSVARLREIYTAPMGATEIAGLTRVAKSWSHGTAKAFAKGLGLDVAEIRSEVEAGSNGKVLAIVRATPNAIGYVSWGEARAAIDGGAPIRILSVDGTRPSLEAIGDESYGLVRTLYLLLPRPGAALVSEATRAFVKHIEGPEGDAALLKHGLAPIRPGV